MSKGNQRIKSEDKIRLVRAYRNLNDYQLLADQLGIKRGTARKIVSDAMKRDDPEDFPEKNRGGAHNVKVDGDMREKISEIIGANAAATLQTINDELRRLLPDKPHISTKHLSKVCRGMFFTLKKLECAPADRNRSDVKDARKEYARWFLEYGLLVPRIVYVDESGFNIWTQRTRGRARIGERAVRTVSGQRGENLTLILAISAQHGVEHYSFHVGGTSASVFGDFFRTLTATIGTENRCIFVLDNAPCHRSVSSLSEHHEVKYLPAYSPMLTPVENAFSAWKWAVKNRLADPAVQALFTDSTEAARHNMNLLQWRRHLLRTHGEDTIPVITQQKCLNWQTHCLSYFPRCLAEEDIFV